MKITLPINSTPKFVGDSVNQNTIEQFIKDRPEDIYLMDDPVAYDDETMSTEESIIGRILYITPSEITVRINPYHKYAKKLYNAYKSKDSQHIMNKFKAIYVPKTKNGETKVVGVALLIR